MKRHFLVGDVHGCTAELKDLVAALAPTAADTFVFVGDLLDKGPDPSGTVGFVRRLSRAHEVVLVEGNHEEKHRRYRAHVARFLDTGKANPMSDPRGELAATTGSLTPADVAFLDSAVLFHRVPEHNVLVLHGGVAPAVTELPADGTRHADLKGKRKRLLGSLLRTRHVDPATGKMVALDQIDPSVHPHWTEVYDGRFGRVVFGHEPFLDSAGLVESRNAVGVALGCCFGNRLAALVLHADGSEETVTVKARDRYASHFTQGE
jgi:hypothetical protein